jgi:hypothetical protein
MYGLSLWKIIRKVWGHFSQLISFKVGDGSSLKFWLDSWCGEISLRDQFPELHRIASHPDALVQDLLTFDGTNFHWAVSFLLAVQDWELESVTLFMELIYSGDLGVVKQMIYVGIHPRE